MLLSLLNPVASDAGGLSRALWPKPRTFTTGSGDSTVFDTVNFMTMGTSRVLHDATERYTAIILAGKLDARAPVAYTVCVTAKDYDAPLSPGDTDESYEISAGVSVANVTAQTVWGALRGIETFSQLVVADTKRFALPPTPIHITDHPRFGWRGLMIDTGRNYLTPTSIKMALDGMAYTKLNVLHWHMTDDESFPVESTSLPSLAGSGAYSPAHTYSHDDIKEVVACARRTPNSRSPGERACGHCMRGPLQVRARARHRSAPRIRHARTHAVVGARQSRAADALRRDPLGVSLHRADGPDRQQHARPARIEPALSWPRAPRPLIRRLTLPLQVRARREAACRVRPSIRRRVPLLAPRRRRGAVRLLERERRWLHRRVDEGARHRRGRLRRAAELLRAARGAVGAHDLRRPEADGAVRRARAEPAISWATREPNCSPGQPAPELLTRRSILRMLQVGGQLGGSHVGAAEGRGGADLEGAQGERAGARCDGQGGVTPASAEPSTGSRPFG